MPQVAQQLHGLEAVRGFVNQTLCSRDNLEMGCFVLSERPLLSGGQVCGIHFCLHGPRSLRLTAIWEVRTNTILFYGSQGERFLKTAAPAKVA